MHSSRMRTGRSLTVCRALLPSGVSASDTPLGADTPQSRHPPEPTPQWEQTPPGADTPGSSYSPLRSRHPQGADTPPGADTPREQTPSRADTPRADTPQSRHPPSRHPLQDQTPPLPTINRITDTSKNITLATTSLRPVTRRHSQICNLEGKVILHDK